VIETERAIVRGLMGHRYPILGARVLGLFLPAASLFVTSPVAAHTIISTRFTFERDVGPILAERCGGCHRPGGIGPMSLLEYKEARPWAAAIRAAVLAGQMPPWPVEEGVRFEGERLLSGREIDVIVDWTRGGAPEGEAAPPPAAPVLAPQTGAWTIDAPDLLLEMPEPHVLAAGAREGRREARWSPALEGDRWIAAWELRPGSPAIVHDAVITLETGAGPPETLGTWTPGQPGAVYPAEAARALPRGSEIILSVHYARGFQHRGVEIRDRSALAFRFAPSAPRRVVRSLRLGREPVLLAEAAALLAVMPVAAAVAKAAKPLVLEARLDGGSARLILAGRAYDPAWPIALRLGEPLRLPAGTALSVRGGGSEAAPVEFWIETAR